MFGAGISHNRRMTSSLYTVMDSGNGWKMIRVGQSRAKQKGMIALTDDVTPVVPVRLSGWINESPTLHSKRWLETVVVVVQFLTVWHSRIQNRAITQLFTLQSIFQCLSFSFSLAIRWCF